MSTVVMGNSGVRGRIDDALLLQQNGHTHGAFLCALVAVAATARKRFPEKAISDRDAFENFVRASTRVTLSVEYRGELHSIEHVFYKWFRCQLVHEAELPFDVEIISEPSLTVRAGGAPNFVLQISDGWFSHLVDAVVRAPENSSDFAGLYQPEVRR